jgi:hypothetical protein
MVYPTPQIPLPRHLGGYVHPERPQCLHWANSSTGGSHNTHGAHHHKDKEAHDFQPLHTAPVREKVGPESHKACAHTCQTSGTFLSIKCCEGLFHWPLGQWRLSLQKKLGGSTEKNNVNPARKLKFTIWGSVLAFKGSSLEGSKWIECVTLAFQFTFTNYFPINFL